MKKSPLLVLSILTSIFFLSCTSAKLSSFTQDDESIKSTSKVVVFGNTDDIALRKIIEKDFVNAFSSKKLIIVSGLDIIPPLKEYTKEEINSALEYANVTHVITVTMPAEGFYPYPNINYEVTIVNLETGNLIYKSNGTCRFDSKPEFKDVSSSLSKAVCADYIKLIQKPVFEEPNELGILPPSADENSEEVSTDSEADTNVEVTE